MDEFFTSRSGHLGLKINGISIHSAYDPLKEAERFLTTRLTTCPHVVLLVGSGLGYLDQVALQKYPQAKVLSVHTCDTYIKKAGLNTLVSHRYAFWTPQCAETIEQFLAHHLSELDLDGLEIVPWPVLCQQDKDYNNVLNSINAFVKRLQASFLSTGYFGWCWFNNILKNFAFCKQHVTLPRAETIVVAASGPSLSAALPLLQECRPHYFLLALPSSLAALRLHNLVPDATIATDGGYYARQHLRYLNTSALVVMPLVASFDPHHPHSLFSFATPFEQALLKDILVPQLNWNGTVAANALMLAHSMGAKRIILVGQDFAPQGVQTHVWPHTFAPFYEEESMRLSPLLNFYQKTLWQSSKSLAIYAHWFQTQAWPASIVRLTPSCVPLPFAEILPQEFLALKKQAKISFKMESAAFLSQDQRFLRIRKLIHNLSTQFVQEKHNPSSTDLWLYMDAMGLYRYRKAQRLNRNVEDERNKLCTKVEERLELLRQRWL